MKNTVAGNSAPKSIYKFKQIIYNLNWLLSFNEEIYKQRNAISFMIFSAVSLKWQLCSVWNVRRTLRHCT
jgi:hypothetical protein